MKQTEQEKPEDAEVRLGPILGVGPTTYVPVLYLAGLLAVLFFILVFPGIRNHGSLLTVVSTPANASVLVDGVRLATSSETILVTSGRRELEVRRPGFEPHRTTLDVGGRLIGSWIAPRRMLVAVSLEARDTAELVHRAVTDFSAWSLAGEASGQYQFPPVARDLASDLSGTASDERRYAWDRFVSDALPQTASQALLNDLAAASLALGGASAVAVPSGIAATVQHLARSAAQADLLALQVATAAGAERGRPIRESDWHADAAATAARLGTSGPGSSALDPADVLIGPAESYPLGLRFVALDGGTVILGGVRRARRGGDLPYAATIEPFRVGTTEVPFSAFDAFLDANPAWAPGNINSLIDGGLADDDYLMMIDAARQNPDLPAAGISAYAAESFASWYTTLLPQVLVARLPTEAEWEYAQRVSGTREGVFRIPRVDGPSPVQNAGTGRGEITGIVGNVWEWTSDWFAPFSHVHGPPALAVHRTVRGGSWGTDAVGFDPADRGALHPAWSSPFVGFRLVLVARPAM